MPPTQSSIQRRHRTFSGCWKCRSRKVKCDETRPCCLNCRRIGVHCSGYDFKFIWMGRDEPLSSQSNGRRVLSSALTWAGYEILSNDHVDLLISSCDESPPCTQARIHYESSYWTSRHHNPFSVFTLRTDSLNPLACPFDPPLPRSPPLLTGPSQDESSLFHHYVTHVAHMMLPYQHPDNPWSCCWATNALQLALSGQKVLYSAILAHSAFNMANLIGNNTKIVNMALRYYDTALSHLKQSFGHGETDSSVILASIMSLVFAEAYRGHSTDWKHHMQGARALARSCREAYPWTLSDLARSSLQSLAVMDIIAESSLLYNNSDIQARHQSLEGEEPNPLLILPTSDFVITIGAPRCILECIAKITNFGKLPLTETLPTTHKLFQEVLWCLDSVQDDNNLVPNNPPEAKHQSRAFISATYIYCYRTLFDVPPHVIRKHVHNTLGHVHSFLTSSTGNLSAWPAFIAAAEAYTPEDLAMAQQWLISATSVGIGSRMSMRDVLHEVWRRRELISNKSGLDPGKIIMDWKQIMHELGCEGLLI